MAASSYTIGAGIRDLIERIGQIFLRRCVHGIAGAEFADYELFAWVVMPNHVHALFQPETGHDLAEIPGAWKSVSTRLINKVRDGRGSVWQREYYDHLIRDEAEFIHAVEYILGNPRRFARLALGTC